MDPALIFLQISVNAWDSWIWIERGLRYVSIFCPLHFVGIYSIKSIHNTSFIIRSNWMRPMSSFKIYSQKYRRNLKTPMINLMQRSSKSLLSLLLLNPSKCSRKDNLFSSLYFQGVREKKNTIKYCVVSRERYSETDCCCQKGEDIERWRRHCRKNN